MRAVRLLTFLCAGTLAVAVGVASEVSACSIRERTTADWLQLEASARAIFVGRVERLVPLSAQEEAEIRRGPRIAGVVIGDRMGHAEIAPVGAVKGQMMRLTERYVSGSFCGLPGWSPELGDNVLVVITADGTQYVFDEDDRLGSNLRDAMSGYW